MYIKDLVSIITPVYNTGPYLDRYFDHVLAQTYKDLDIIIIDDGSTDPLTKQIIEDRAASDPRIRVFSGPNVGNAMSINKALPLVRGEYTVFIDSDDYIDKDAIAYMVKELSSSDADLLQASYWLDLEHMVLGRTRPKNAILRKPESIYQLTHDTGVNNYVWAKMYRSELLEGLSFSTAYDTFADMEFVARAMCKADKVLCRKRRLYYCQHKRSMTDHMSVATIRDMLTHFKAQEDLLNELCPGYGFSNHRSYYRTELILLAAYMLDKTIKREDVVLPDYDRSKIWLPLRVIGYIIYRSVKLLKR